MQNDVIEVVTLDYEVFQTNYFRIQRLALVGSFNGEVSFTARIRFVAINRTGKRTALEKSSVISLIRCRGKAVHLLYLRKEVACGIPFVKRNLVNH